MSLANLNIQEMVSLTESWVTDHSGTFLSIPEIAGLHALVKDAHQTVVAAAACAAVYEKAALRGCLRGGYNPPGREARNKWIRVVGLVIDVLELAKASDAVKTIRDPILAASER